MGTLYIDRKELHVRLDGDALAFYANGEREGIVPINPLTRVIMVGNITLETSVLNRLANDNISVLFLSGKRNKFCGMLHGKLHNNGALRVRQYEKSLSDNFSIEAAAEIVKRKITGQKDLLEQARERRPDLRLELTNAMGTLQGVLTQVEGKITPSNPPYANGEEKNPPLGLRGDQGELLDTLRGLEGGASASYFSAYTKMFPDSLGFSKRNRRPPEDPVNAILSLCYTLVHFDIVREIEIIGLDPVIGFYHQFDYGRESLACDLIEPYRPMVDRFVWEIFRDRTFTSRDFAMNDERPGCYLKKESRKRFYPTYEEWVQNTRPLWVEDVRGLARRIMDGQDTVYKSDE
jgi:CRISPR-associated protein Cas1